MPDYIAIHTQTFDALAEEYDRRWRLYKEHQSSVLGPFIEALLQNGLSDERVLDVGCGVGLDAYILVQRGFAVDGIDLSPAMIARARRNVPMLNAAVGDFMALPVDRCYGGVILDAFIHLFPRRDVSALLRRVKDLLRPNGLAFISTTVSDATREGWLEKTEYGSTLKRYRTRWPERELTETLERAGFAPFALTRDVDPVFHRTWMNFIIRPRSKNTA